MGCARRGWCVWLGDEDHTQPINEKNARNATGAYASWSLWFGWYCVVDFDRLLTSAHCACLSQHCVVGQCALSVVEDTDGYDI